MSFLWCARPQHRNLGSPIEQYTLESKVEEDSGAGVSQHAAEPVEKMTEFLPTPGHYHLLTVIGRCCDNAGSIHLARHIPSGTLVAVKTINLEDTNIDFSMLQHEILMHRFLAHSNILESLCSFVHENEIWSVMPLMAYGSCRDLSHAHFTDGLSELAIAFILREVLIALDYMHQKGIIHRNVRSSHVLIASSGKVCLTGLRNTYSMIHEGRRFRTVHDFPNGYNKALFSASPEILEQNLAGYDTKSDVYSVGILGCELANGIVPFSDIPSTQMLLEKLDGITPQLLDSNTMPDLRAEENNTIAGTHTDSGIGDSVANQSMAKDVSSNPFIQRTFSQQFHHFISMCMQNDTRARPTAAVLLQHAFFRQIKRKLATESLPDLLQPVTPLTDVANLPTGNIDVEGISEKVASLAMEEDCWDF